MRFSLLGSGSSGNAMLIVAGKTRILVDCGLSFRQLKLRTEAIGETLDGLSAVFITHEHGDHVSGLGVLSRKLNMPIYLSPGTAERLPKSLGRVERLHPVEAGDSVQVGDMRIESFSVNHDAADPVSYVVHNGRSRVGIATDLGRVTTLVRQRLAGCTALVLESNYCPAMLRTSSYPESIRQRISSGHGHLSNPDMSSLLADVLHEGLRLVVVVHVSQENNTMERARSLAQGALKSHDAELFVSEQDRPTPLFDLEAEQVSAPLAS